MAENNGQKRKSEKIGLVVSDRMAKTIVVEVTRRVPHPVYKRIITKRKKFYAHDEAGTARVGDTVRILESRPMSHLKRWTLGEVIRRAVDVGPVNLTSKEALPSKKAGTKGAARS